MRRTLVLLDASAFWRLGSRQLDPARRRQVAEWIARGIVAASTLLLLETRAGRDLPPVDPGELPWLWINERAERGATDLQHQLRAERGATDLQHQLRAAHQHLGVPPLDYLIAAVAEDHSASILHYDRLRAPRSQHRSRGDGRSARAAGITALSGVRRGTRSPGRCRHTGGWSRPTSPTPGSATVTPKRGPAGPPCAAPMSRAR